jgi:hypothetical protein
LEEDPLDDMDVSDSDEGSGGGEEEENDPSFDDEFDDGYWENLRDESVIYLSSTIYYVAMLVYVELLIFANFIWDYISYILLFYILVRCRLALRFTA